MGHDDQRVRAPVGRDAPAQVGRLPRRRVFLAVGAPAIEERIGRWPGRDTAEGFGSRVEAAAPAARQYVADRHVSGTEDLAEPAGLPPAVIGQVALRRAVLQLEPGRITDAGHGLRMAQYHDRAAGAQCRPGRIGRCAALRVGRRGHQPGQCRQQGRHESGAARGAEQEGTHARSLAVVRAARTRPSIAHPDLRRTIIASSVKQPAKPEEDGR